MMQKTDAHIRKAIDTLWDYLCLKTANTPADAMVILGNNECLSLALKAAELYKAGLAPVIVVSGGVKRTFNYQATRHYLYEADFMAMVLRDQGVPSSAIIVEDKSTNTGENYTYSLEFLKKKNLAPKKFIVVTLPYITRRAFATGMKRWPDKTLQMAGSTMSLDDYLKGPNADKVVHQMVGTLERIIEYPEQGFQIPQKIPANVVQAYITLKKAGYVGDFKRSPELVLPRKKPPHKHLKHG